MWRIAPTAADCVRCVVCQRGAYQEIKRGLDLSESRSNRTPGNFVNTITGTSDFGPFPANMIGRNAFRGPGSWGLDFGLYKRFAITERVGLQFRSEFYNVFNHPNLFISGSEAEVNTGFVPAFFAGGRSIQLAAKLTF
jgi:hypothetical protein